MKLRSKALLASLGAAAPLVGLLAQPAAAGSIDVIEDFTIVHGGQEATCSVRAVSTIGYDSRSDRTLLGMRTQMITTDGVCQAAVVSTRAFAFYRFGDGSEEGTDTRSDSNNVETYWVESGAVASFSVNHSVTFGCDDGPNGLCEVHMGTTTK
jgi:hypothetical protein